MLCGYFWSISKIFINIRVLICISFPCIYLHTSIMGFQGFWGTFCFLLPTFPFNINPHTLTVTKTVQGFTPKSINLKKDNWYANNIIRPFSHAEHAYLYKNPYERAFIILKIIPIVNHLCYQNVKRKTPWRNLDKLFVVLRLNYIITL